MYTPFYLRSSTATLKNYLQAIATSNAFFLFIRFFYCAPFARSFSSSSKFTVYTFHEFQAIGSPDSSS